ncbi:1527_t:CDS:2, partial [Gigaspora margarita]
QEVWDETEIYALENRLQGQDRENKLPLTLMGGEPNLIEELDHVDVESDSGDTFDEFTYEKEMLDKIEGYYTEELATEEIGTLETFIDKYFDKIIQETDLDETKREQAREFFKEEKGLFAQSTK